LIMADQDEIVLSEREMEILRLVATGATNLQIAHDLVISVNTVKVHLRNVFEKLGVQSRTELTLYAIRKGWIVVEEGHPPAAVEEESLAAEVAEPEAIAWEAAPLPPLSLGRRLYFITAALLVVLGLFLTQERTEGSSRGVSDNPLSDHSAASPASGSRLEVSRWSALARLPAPRSRLAVVAYEDKLYAIGGDGPDGVTGALYIYDPATDRWTAGKPKPTATTNIGAAVLSGRIYVPGGYGGGGQVISTVEVYDPARETWEEATPLPAPLCAYAIAALDGQLYLFGGWDGARYMDSVYAYDPVARAWFARSPMPTPRAFLGVGVVDGWAYLLGGFDGSQELKVNEVYDPETDSWSARLPMAQGRAGLSVATVGSSIYVIGGGWQSYLVANERYDPRTDTWAGIETPMVGQWRNLGTAVVGPNIYAVGGWSGDYLDVNEKYQAIFRILIRFPP
jgi:DNA-binding CsgD family transcriptional regulator/N-acetylneuraminic acid mutarotase